MLKESNARIIVIDPGHGGKNSGNIGMDGVKEKNIALKLALKILLLNKKMISKFTEGSKPVSEYGQLLPINPLKALKPIP